MSRKVVIFFTVSLLLIIGFFSGAIYEQQERISYDKTNSELYFELRKERKDCYFWKEGYLKRDTALQEISAHKDCTFELKTIIGNIN